MNSRGHGEITRQIVKVNLLEIDLSLVVGFNLPDCEDVVVERGGIETGRALH